MLLRAAIVVLVVLNAGVAAWWIGGGVAPSRLPPAPTAGGPGLQLASERRAPQPAPATAACVRFGPFADPASRDALRPALAGATLLRPHQAPARQARGWRVHLPPLPSREQASAMAERMRAAGIDDLYVMGDGEEPNSIALGRYGNEQAARRRETELRALGFPALAAPIGSAAARWWLDAQLPPGSDAAAYAALAPSMPLDCQVLAGAAPPGAGG